MMPLPSRLNTARWVSWSHPTESVSYWQLGSADHDNAVRFSLTDSELKQSDDHAIGDHVVPAARAYRLIQHEDY